MTSYPEVWFSYWIGLSNDLYFFRRNGEEMPEASVLAWLGFLLGELEGNRISEIDYDKLRAMLPFVKDEFTPLIVATRYQFQDRI